MASDTTMAAQMNGVVSLQASEDIISPSKSKKRKHEGDLRRSSSKKRKHETTDIVAPSLKPDQLLEPLTSGTTSDKKKKKKKKVTEESPEPVVEDAAPNGDRPIGADTPLEEAVADDVEPTPRPDKKKKKQKAKKDAELPDTEQTNSDDHTLPSNTSKAPGATKPAASDIELPDAPPTATDDPLTASLLDTAITSITPPQIADLLSSSDPSPFYSTRLSLYLSLPAIALSTQHGLSSILAQHLSPLLLTYFPPARGIVLAFSDPVLSARASTALGGALRPPPAAAAASVSTTGEVRVLNAHGQEANHPREVLAQAADEFGACWAWLTVTFLVFRPARGDEMVGWTNVVSEGFVGIVAYNYFQAAVGKERVPAGWRWSGADTGVESTGRKRGRKGRLGDGVLGVAPSQDSAVAGAEGVEAQTRVYGKRDGDDDAGYFVDAATGEKASEVLKFRVVDTEMVPGHEAGSLSLQIDATLLDEEAEKRVLEEDKARYERQAVQRQQRRNTATTQVDMVMSGGLEG